MKTALPDTVEEIELPVIDRRRRFADEDEDQQNTARREALMRLVKRMMDSGREHLVLGIYCENTQSMVSGGIIVRYTACEAKERRSEFADFALRVMAKVTVFTFTNSELAKVIEEAPEKNDPLKHLDWEGHLCARCVTEGQRRMVLGYLKANP